MEIIYRGKEDVEIEIKHDKDDKGTIYITNKGEGNITVNGLQCTPRPRE